MLLQGLKNAPKRLSGHASSPITATWRYGDVLEQGVQHGSLTPQQAPAMELTRENGTGSTVASCWSGRRGGPSRRVHGDVVTRARVQLYVVASRSSPPSKPLYLRLQLPRAPTHGWQPVEHGPAGHLCYVTTTCWRAAMLPSRLLDMYILDI